MKNVGGAVATAPISITDALPAGETATAVTAGADLACVLVGGGTSVTCTRSNDLAAGASTSRIVVKVAYGAAATGSLVDTARVARVTGETNLDNNVDTVTTKLTGAGPCTENVFFNTNNPPSGAIVLPGQLLTVQYSDESPIGTGTNGGGAPILTVDGVVQTTGLTVGPDSAAGRDKHNVLLSYRLPATLSDGSHTVTIQAFDSDQSKPGGDCDIASWSLTVTSPSLSVVKTGPATAVAGTDVDYTLTVTNSGAGASPATTVTDALPAGETFVAPASCNPTAGPSGQAVTCPVGPLAAGATQTITVRVRFAANASGDYRDCATLIGSPANASCVTTSVKTPDLKIVKTGPATAAGNGQSTYTIVISNIGQATSAATTLTDTLPYGEAYISSNPTCAVANVLRGQAVTCTVPALAAGANASYSVVVQFSAAAAGSYTDCAAVPQAAGDTTDNNTSCVTTTVTPPAVVPEPDVSIVKNGPQASVQPGDRLTYTLIAANTGQVVADGVHISDALPAGLTLVSASGTGWTCTGAVECSYGSPLAVGASAPTVTVVADLAKGYRKSSIANTGTITPSDVTPADNTSTLITPVEQPGLANPDLAIVKTGPNRSVRPGDEVPYLLTVRNTGVVPATGFVVTDPLGHGLTFVSASGAGFSCMGPGVSCTYAATLAPGDTAAVQVVARLASPYTASTVRNTAIVSPTDDTPGDNTSTLDVPVQQPGLAAPDLGIVKTGPRTSVQPGDAVAWSLVVTNTGVVAASGFTVSDPFPVGVAFLSSGGPGFSCDSTMCTYAGSLAPGATATVTMSGRLDPSYKGHSLVNTAVVGPADATPGDNTSTARTPVRQPITGTPQHPGQPASRPPTAVPFTGAPTDDLLILAGLLLLVGGGALLGARRQA